MNNKNIKKLSQNAILTALVFVSLKVISIPTPIGGVINISDALILTISVMTFRKDSVLVGSLGSFLAELLSPYAIFAPATLIIKGAVAFTSHTLYHHLRIGNDTLKMILSFVCAEIVMIIGYFIFQAFFLGLGVAVASLDIVNNTIQALASTLIAIILSKILIKNKLNERLI